MPEPTNLALERIARDLQRLIREAEKAERPLLCYLLDMALVEARRPREDDQDRR